MAISQHVWITQKRALQALKIRDSLPAAVGPVGAGPLRLAVYVLAELAQRNLQAIHERVDLEVDIQEVTGALLSEMLPQDEHAALLWLDGYLARGIERIARQTYPLLAVSLCVRFATYFKAKNDIFAVGRMVAKALTKLPREPNLRAEALEILGPFWHN